jgi:hypothetical protein
VLTNETLHWLGLFASAYILMPLCLTWLRWRSHDRIRRQVRWYVLFNALFTITSFSLAKLDRSGNNLLLFYVASPLLVVLVYRIYDAMVLAKQTTVPTVWWVVRGLVVAYCLFVVVDMIWLEDPTRQISKIIYPPEKALIVTMAFYFLYRFSSEARSDFSSLWIGAGIGLNALLNLVILFYSPHIGMLPGSVGYFLWWGLGSIVTLTSYSMIAYGLWIFKPRRVQVRSAHPASVS